MTPQIIQAGKVVLRPKRAEDAPDDYAWRCDEELAALDATTPLRQSYDEFLLFYQQDIKHRSPWSVRYGIDISNGKHIGNCMCYDINVNYAEAELGIMIGDRNYWSQSYGYHTMLGLIDHMFTTTNLRRLYLHTLERNHRAQRCFQKCGFKFVRRVHRHGWDLIQMDLLRDNWFQTHDKIFAKLQSEEPRFNQRVLSNGFVGPHSSSV